MIYGYNRVSTKGQDRYGNGKDVQEEALLRAGAEVIYYDSYTGTKLDRPELTKLLSILKPGDQVVVMKMDRIARNVRVGLEIIDTILAKGCSITIINMGTFDNTPMSRLQRSVLLAIAEFERDTIVERTESGKEVARQKPGYKEGRPVIEIPEEEFQKIFAKQKRGEITVQGAADALGVSKRTYQRRVKGYEVDKLTA